MRRRLFFIVKELNDVNSASLTAVSYASYLNEEYDVFLCSIETIRNGKINENYRVSPRVRLKSLDVPCDYKERKQYIKKYRNLIKDNIQTSSRDGDVFIMFDDELVDLLPNSCLKILITGFSSIKNYNNFDEIIFSSKKDYDELCTKHKKLNEKASIILPFPIYEREENFKFHGNRIMCISRISLDNDLRPVFDLAKGLKDNNVKFNISLCGNGDHFNEIKNQLVDNKIDDVVTLKHVEDIDKNLIESDLMFYFSDGEEYPVHVIEAISSSVPIVSFSKNKYIGEIIDNVGVSADSKEDVLDKVINILKDKIKLAKLKFKTYEHSKNYIKEKALRQIKIVIERFYKKYE